MRSLKDLATQRLIPQVDEREIKGSRNRMYTLWYIGLHRKGAVLCPYPGSAMKWPVGATLNSEKDRFFAAR